MADKNTSGGAAPTGVPTEQVKLVLTVVSTFGVGSILVVIIGRLWTLAYFEYFGLTTADLEFSIDDFAFRSLEVLISLGLGGIGVLVAWHAKAVFKAAGLRSFLLEVAAVVGAVLFMFLSLGPCVDRWSWLAWPGILGVVSGIVLIFMIVLVADVWFGPEDERETPSEGQEEQEAPSEGQEAGLLKRLLEWLGGIRIVRAAIANLKRPVEWLGGIRVVPEEERETPSEGQEEQEAPSEGQEAGLLKRLLEWLGGIRIVRAAIANLKRPVEWLGGIRVVRAAIANWRKLLAGGMMVLLLFVYIPLVTGRLARIQAESDLKEGRLPVAILESMEAPLPSAIASDEPEFKSEPVRVILAQRQNTYVLDSTRCKAIGELKVEEIDGGTFVRDPNVCKVFAIPTSRLKSIEYRMVTGTPPSNDTSFSAQAVDPGEPLDVTVCTTGASDDEGIHCQEDHEEVSFYNTIWYKVSPVVAGTLLARATSLEADLEPIVAVWEGSEEGVVQPKVAPGSGPGGRACEASSDGDAVGTVANLKANKTYFVVIGTQDDQEGDFGVHIQFTTDGLFYSRDVEIDEDMQPEVQVECVDDRVELELREVDRTTYEWKALDAKPAEFFLTREEPDEKADFAEGSDAKEDRMPLALVGELEAYEERTLLAPVGVLEPGTWTLEVPDSFVGQVRPILTRTLQHDLVLAFADTSAPPLNDIRAQAALLLVIDPGKIRDKLGLEGLVIFEPKSHDPDALTFDPGEDPVSAAGELLEQAGISAEELKKLRVQIHVYPATEEERGALRTAAAMVRNQVAALGVTATVDQDACEGICICVFFRKRAYSISTASSEEAAAVGSTS
ncbi:MAG: hypothetical protein WBF66_00100 [Dehalococcoidia bacterium]